MADKYYFHFTIGPVQGFVAQARRTRDFWAGSFLLSWLSGVAMAEIQRQGGIISFPLPADNYLDWIQGQANGEAPRQGGIPNRFKAISAEVPKEFDGKLLEQTVRAAWIALAEHVWKKDELGQISSEITRQIWDRQNHNFWEISWVKTTDQEASLLLDQRKNWRSHYPQAEGGVKCMMMDGWQELSGSLTPGLSSKKKDTELKRFWTQLRGLKRSGMQTDLAEDEHLCALAYVKRRFARYFDTFSATLPSGLKLKGWKLAVGMPSVSYMAAVHWLEKLVECVSPSELAELLTLAKEVNPARDEWDTRIQCLVRQREGKTGEALDNLREFLSLDANMFFEHVQEKASLYLNSNDLADEQKKKLALEKLKISIEKLQRKVCEIQNNHPKFQEPLSPFYAILLMDGDSLGSHMSKEANQKPISTALNDFTGGVPAIVENHNGFLIYAGGDDVLALLPMEDALRCAAEVRRHYLASFQEAFKEMKDEDKIPASISAAIQYVHVKTPLGIVLGDAHHLLDDVAKDGAGRDAVAVKVWKTGGVVLEWAQPWKIALDESGQVILENLVETFKDPVKSVGDFAGFSNKFFFKIDERFALLNPRKDTKGQYAEAVLSAEQAIDLLAVDYKNSADNRDLTLDMAKSFIRPLLTQCRMVTRDKEKDDKPEDWAKSPLLKPDAALLVRFFAQKGVDA